MIMLSVLVMNLETILRDLLFALLGLRWNRAPRRLKSAWQGFRRRMEPWFLGDYAGNMALGTVQELFRKPDVCGVERRLQSKSIRN